MAKSTCARTSVAGAAPEINLAQACDLASEIAASAARAEQLCYYFAPQDDNVDHYQLQLDVLRDMVKRMGWLADLCSGKLGASPVLGGAEAWMTSPLYLHRDRGEA